MPNSSQGDGSLPPNHLFESNMHQPHGEDTLSNTLGIPTATVINQVTVQDQSPLITPPPDLRRRDPVPQDNNCQQAEQSASQAVREASQSASQSIQQAQQSVSQASREAGQSASDAIRQAQQSASQSIAAASRDASQSVSSANSVVASVQSSASAAISRANGSAITAQASASSVQAEASSAILQAGAAVAAATGSAASAGQSFLSAAAAATLGAQASLAVIGAAASSSASEASAQVSASQSAAVTATQAALAIVGSIIASTLITILIYFLIIRHKKLVKRRSRDENKSLSPRFPSDPKFPTSAEIATTAAPSQSAYNVTRKSQRINSEASLSDFPNTPRRGDVKTTSLAWNPTQPPKPPTLGSWLRVQDGVSPFGSIKLPTDSESKSPLGGQIKSPLRSFDPPQSPKQERSTLFNNPNPNISQSGTIPAAKQLIKSFLTRKPLSPENSDSIPKQPPPENPTRYRESTASVWTDEIPNQTPSPPLRTPPPELRTATVAQGYNMQLPASRNPVRTTAEWLESIQEASASNQTQRNSIVSRSSRGAFGLPRNPKPGLQSRFSSNQGKARSIEWEIGFVQGLDRFLPGDRTSRIGSDNSTPGGSRRKSNVTRIEVDRTSIGTPGVGRAM
ncbi:uncharacterized protein BP5553_10432 [Venustampulla echinocandica]|uniref:Uncharacterized protein n=1 Tax=Venustampulla echinocandica TaxID=2656787 RepID=A0A370T9A7_9HELO|nr:uncharacterized protein BP5553_10432 [Venustampulla echinocandica]RDL30154.1 hypothetical protein BP5553_10432 [Venustampulla echinocandica]